MKWDWSVLIESLKEPARIILFAVIAWLLTVIVPQLPPQFVPIATIILKFIDEWLHQAAKAEGPKDQIKGVLGLKGLTGF